MNYVFTCPVSIGELIDKLTILDIKLKYILDNRRNDVEKEFNLLYSQISDKIDNYKYYYNLMKKINEDIWHLMDKIRVIDFEKNKDIWIQYCKQTIDYNDIRFRIKNKINNIYNSTIKEQKGYTPTKYVISCSKNDDLHKLLVIIKFNSFLFDNVELQCTSDVYSIISNKIDKNDNTIIFNIKNDNDNETSNIDDIYNKFISTSELFNFIDNLEFKQKLS
jgi:hypothetical protein